MLATSKGSMRRFWMVLAIYMLRLLASPLQVLGLHPCRLALPCFHEVSCTDVVLFVLWGWVKSENHGFYMFLSYECGGEHPIAIIPQLFYFQSRVPGFWFIPNSTCAGRWCEPAIPPFSAGRGHSFGSDGIEYSCATQKGYGWTKKYIVTRWLYGGREIERENFKYMNNVMWIRM